MSPAWLKSMPNVATTSGRTTARLIASNPSKKVPPPTTEARRRWNRPVGTRSIRAAMWPAVSGTGVAAPVEGAGPDDEVRGGEAMEFSCERGGEPADPEHRAGPIPVSGVTGITAVQIVGAPLASVK